MIEKNIKNRAELYIQTSKIQKYIAKQLVSKLSKQPLKILDLGCGTGYVYEAISWKLEKFIALDRDLELLSHHPREDIVECICADFEMIDLPSFYYYLSSSSLQWSADIEAVFKKISSKAQGVGFSIFTSNSFKDFHHKIGSTSPLYSKEMLEELLFANFKDIKLESQKLDLEFEDSRALVDFLRYSGMFKKDREIDYKLAKKLISSDIKEDSIEILYAYNI